MADYFTRPNDLPDFAFDPANLPEFAPPPPKPPRNAFAAGFSSGIDDNQAALGAGAAMVGKLIGSDSLEQYGLGVHQRNSDESKANGRPDLDGNPFRADGPGLAQLPAWFAYQGAKQVPLVLGTMAAAAGLGALPFVGAGASAIAGATGLTRLGMAVGGRLGMSEAAAGALGREGLLSGAVQYPISAGSLYGSALEREGNGGEAADRGDAAKAALMGVPYAAAEGAFPTLLHGMSKGLTTQTWKGRVLKGLAVGAAEEIPTEAVQTAMEMSFRSDLSQQEKIDQIVDAAVIGGAVGGMFGGGAGAISGHAKHGAPNEVTDEDTKSAIDAALNANAGKPLALPGPTGAPGQQTIQPSGPTTFVDPTGNAAQGVNSIDGMKRPDGTNAGLSQLDINQQTTDAVNSKPPPSRAQQFADYSDTDLQHMLEAATRAQQSTSIRVLSAELERRAAGGEQAPASPGFQTAKGSLYELHDDGTTTRNKALRNEPGHEGDEGVKPRSAKTVYATKDAARALEVPAWTRPLVPTLEDIYGPKYAAGNSSKVDPADAGKLVVNKTGEASGIAGFDTMQGQVRLVDGTEMPIVQNMGLLVGKDGVHIDYGVVSAFKNDAEGAKWVDVQRPGAAGQAQAGPNFRIIDHGNGTLSVATPNPNGGWGIAPGQRNIAVQSEPALGLHPVELWGPEHTDGKVSIVTPYRGVHPGSEITNIFQSGASTLIPELDQAQANGVKPSNDIGAETKQTEEPSDARARRVNIQTMQQKALDLLGTDAEGKPAKPNQFIKGLTAENDVELAHAVLDHLDGKGKNDAKALTIAQKMGLLDENRQPVDHAPLIADTQGQLAAARVERLAANPNDDLRAPLSEKEGAHVSGLTNQLATLRSQQALAQNVQQRRAGGTAVEQQAQSEATTPASTGPAPELQLNLRSPVPTGSPDTRNALRDIAARGGVNRNTAHSTARQMAPRSMGEAVRGTLEYLNSKSAARWAAPYKAWGVYFGLIKNGQVQSIAQAIENTQQALDAAQRAGDATTAGPLAQRLDVLSAAQTENLEKPITGPSAVTPQTGGASIESKARQASLTEAMHNIEADTTVDEELRQRARVVRAMVEQRAATAEEKAHALMADYSAQTGRNLGSMSMRAGPSVDRSAQRMSGGEVISDNGRVALVRHVDHEGANVYSATKVLPDGSVHDDVQSIHNEKFNTENSTHPFTEGEVSQLRAEAKAHLSEDLNRKDDNPEGPFANIEPGMNVVGSESMDPKLTNTLSQWLQMLGLDHVRVFLFHTSDLVNAAAARAKYALNGSFSPVFQHQSRDPYGSTGRIGGRPGDHYIRLRDGMNEQHSVTTMGHEVGHIIETEVLDRLPASVKQKIIDVFHRWLEQKKGLTLARDYIRAMRASEMGKVDAANVSSTAHTSQLEGYWSSFGEFWADQVAKQLTTAEKPVGVIQKFFSELGTMLRGLANLMNRALGNKDALPVSEIKDFLDKMAETRNADTFIKEMGGKGVRTSNTETIRGPGAMAQGPGVNAQTANSNTEEVMRKSDTVLARAKDMWDDFTLKAFRVALGWFDVNHISVQSEKRGFDHVRLYEDAREYREALSIKFTNLLHAAIKTYEQATHEVRDIINELMRATELRIDPRKLWEAHKHLWNAPNASELKKEVERLNGVWNKLGRLEQGKYQALYNMLHAGNIAVNNARMAMITHGTVTANADAQAALKWADPTNDFLANKDLNGDPVKTAAYWTKVMEDRQTELGNYIDSLKAQLTDAPKALKEDIGRTLTVLEGFHDNNYAALKSAEQAPNFHLGRVGEFFVAFDLKTIGGEGKNKGDAHPAAVRRLKNELDRKGFDEVQISSQNGTKDVFIRVQTASEAKRLEALLRSPRLMPVVSNVMQGMRSSTEINERVTPEWLRKFEANVVTHFSGTIARLTKEDAEGNKEKIEQLKQTMDFVRSVLREQYLDSLPDSDIAKVLVHREAIPGYHPDMFRNNAFRMQLGTNSLATIAAAPRVTEAFQAMKDQIKADQTNQNLTPHQRAQRQMVMEELQKREANRAKDVGETWGDHLRAFNHNWYLAVNTAYAAINVMQLGITTLPELAKNGGYIKAMQVMAKNSAAALRLVFQTFKASAALGWRHMGDGTITNEVLANSNLSARQMEIITQLANKGALNLGGQSRQVGQVAQRPTPGRNSSFGDHVAHNWAGAMNFGASFGLYTEMYSRVLAGLSAAEMAPAGVDPVQHARKVIKETLYDYNSWNAPRMMGKHSPLFGQATPAMLQFQNYSAFTMMKLSREFMDLFDGERRAGAAKFLAGHVAALTVFTGTMGIPFFNMFAKAAEMMKDMFGDDDKPWDAKASYRLWLAETFGKSAGEMIAHGPVSRALGQEITQRAGEADLLPFSQLLTDKREMKDRLKDMANREWGAIWSMGTNIATGMEELAKGNTMKGMQDIMPTFIKNALKAYDMSENGYVDKNGGAVPIIKPDGMDIANQLLGFMPANKAEYNEENFANTQHDAILQKQASNIRQNLAVSIERQDEDGRAEWTAKAQSFDQSNPAYAILPKLASVLRSRQNARMVAEAMHQPVGVNMKDQSARDQLGFANY